MTEHFKAPEKIQLSNKEIPNLSDAEFKTLVIRMLTELIQLSHKMKEEKKATQSEIKKNLQGHEGNQGSNKWFGAERRNKQSTRTE